MLILAVTDEAEGHHEPGHPEQPLRVTAALQGVEDLHLGSSVHIVTPKDVAQETLHRVHSPAYLESLVVLSRTGGGALGPDTYVTTASWEAARNSAGAGLAAVEALAARDRGVALVISRPPGHHATRQTGMGFCLLNNVAIAAAHLVAQGERVLVVDWDVHHGNGTQDVFYQERQVLYASVHQHGIYPGSGLPSEVGAGPGHGLTVNVPVPAGATGDVVRQALDQVVTPAVERFGPTWVLVSAGFDAHRADPLADLALSASDFAALASTVADYAPSSGRLVLFLEGGYNLEALRHSVKATVGRLLGIEDDTDEGPTAGGPGRQWVEQAAEFRHQAQEGGG